MIKSGYVREPDDMNLYCNFSDQRYVDENCKLSFMKTCESQSDISWTKASACELKKRTGLDIGSTDCPRGAWSKDNVRVSSWLNNFEVKPTLKTQSK